MVDRAGADVIVPEITSSSRYASPIPVTVTFKNGQPGLTAGTLSGDMDKTTPNPGNLGVDPLGPSASELVTTSPWAGNTTIIYSGYVYDADGVMSFTEHIDDKAWLKVNGELILDDSGWNARSSGSINTGSGGWFPFELRMSNGEGGAGKVGTPGFGWDPEGGTNFTHPQNANASTANLFGVTGSVDPANVTGFTAADLNVTGAAVANFTAVSGSTYTFDLVPDTFPSTVTLGIPEAAATSGNATTSASSATILHAFPADLVGVTVAEINAGSRTHATTFPVEITFRKDGNATAVTGFDVSDLNVTGAAISGFTGSGANYSFNHTPTLPIHRNRGHTRCRGQERRHH